MINPRFSYWKTNSEATVARQQIWRRLRGAAFQVSDASYRNIDSVSGRGKLRNQRMDASGAGKRATEIG